VSKLDEALGKYFGDRRVDVGAEPLVEVPWAQPIMKCRFCAGDVCLRQKKDNQGYYLGCSLYPECRASLWFPAFVTNIEIAPTTCPNVSPNAGEISGNCNLT